MGCVDELAAARYVDGGKVPPLQLQGAWTERQTESEQRGKIRYTLS